MARRARVAAIVILAITLAAAASAPPQKFSAERFKAHVTFLADDLLEGREAGTRGHEIAARYVASQFALMGVKPGGEDGTYYEQAEFAEASTGRCRPWSSRGRRLRAPSDRVTRRSCSDVAAGAPWI